MYNQTILSGVYLNAHEPPSCSNSSLLFQLFDVDGEVEIDTEGVGSRYRTFINATIENLLTSDWFTKRPSDYMDNSEFETLGDDEPEEEVSII